MFIKFFKQLPLSLTDYKNCLGLNNDNDDNIISYMLDCINIISEYHSDIVNINI